MQPDNAAAINVAASVALNMRNMARFPNETGLRLSGGPTRVKRGQPGKSVARLGD